MSKKKFGKKNTKNLGDVTINDFANSVSCKSRLKKSNAKVTTIIKQLETMKPWDETDDFEEDFDFVKEENEDGVVSVVLKKRTRHRSKSSSQDCFNGMEDKGNSYPIDVWFLISDYIVPEDVGRFAGICRASLGVVQSAKFWFSLYKRFYQGVPALPERLQPECLLRRYSIRASVVRALFYMYTPFINRLKGFGINARHPDELRKRSCILMWYDRPKQTKFWYYYFKFKNSIDNRVSRTNYESKQPDILEMLDDVCANPEENCKVLQVCCLHFVPVPVVLGLTLASVSLGLSQGLQYHRLVLRFSSGVYASSQNSLSNSNVTPVELDAVMNFKIIDWWHPLYPHEPPHYSIKHLLTREES